MARGSSNRDVTLTLSVDTLGEDGIKKLEQSIRALADQGGAAAPEFQQLANEIDRISQQQQALTAFKALGDETEQLAQRQKNVATAVDVTATKLQELAKATGEAKTKQAEASAELDKAQKSYNAISAELKAYKQASDASIKGTDDYNTKLRELITAQANAKNAIVDAKTEQRAANSELSQAEAAQNKLVTALKKQETALASANKALTENNTEIRQAAAAAEQLGVSTADVAAAEASLLAAFNSVGKAAATRKAAIDDIAESDRLLAIETATLAELQRRGADALQAEVLAQREAAQVVREYEAAVAQAANNAAQWQREAEAVVNAAEAAQRLQRETVTLVAAQQELQQQNAFERQANDAKRLIQAADYVRFWTDALDKADKQAAETAAAAESSAKRIDDAFKTLGVRSVQDLQLEIANTRVAMALAAEQARTTGTNISGAFAAGEAKVQALERQIRELTGTLTTADRAAALFQNSLGQIAAGNIIADGVGYLVNKVKELGREFIVTIAQTEQLRRGLNAVYGDVAITAKQIDFLRATALNAGVSVGSLQSNFTKFAASMNSANIQLEQSNALFAAVTRAAGTLGIAGEEVSGMLQALAQIASKSTVSMEELRQQLGDRLPGAIGLAAKGLGITEAQLIKLVEAGSLAARDFFPAFTEALKTMGGEVSGLRPAFENLKTALTTSAQAAGDAGWTRLLVIGLQSLSGVLGLIISTVHGFSEALFLANKAALAFFRALRGDPTALSYLNKELRNTRDRLALTAKTFFDVATGAQTAAPEVKKSADQLAAHQAALEKNATAAENLAAKAVTTAEGIKALGEANASSAALSAGNSQAYIKLSVSIAEVLKSLDKKQEAADKEAKAVEITGASLTKLAELRGNEKAALDAASTAANNNVAALEKAAVLRQSEVDVLNVQRKALIELALAQDGSLEKRKAEIDAINQKLIKAGAEAEQSTAAVEKSKAEAFARDLVSKAYADNSARVEEFAKAVLAAREALSASEAAFRAGKVSADDLTAANKRLTEAEYLLRDALNDKVKAIKAVSDLQQANLAVSLAGVNARKAEYDQLIQTARAYGNEAEAVYYEIEAKKLQIEITKLTSQAKKLEAEATIQAALAEREQLASTGNLTEVKRKEIEARLLNAKAKAIEAQASEQVITAMQRDIELMQRRLQLIPVGITGINDDTAARLKNADATEKQVAAGERLIATNNKMNAAASGPAKGSYGELLNNTPSGGTTRTVETGQAINKPAGDWYYTTNPAEYAIRGVDASGRVLVGGWAPVRGPAGIGGTTPGFGNLGGGGGLGQGSGLVPVAAPSTPTPSPAPAPTATPSTVVNVTIGGQTFTANVNSQSDANAFVAALERAYQLGGG